MGALLIAALLTIVPHFPLRAAVISHQADLAAQADHAAASHGIPVAILVAVGFCETHLGLDRGEGGNWGAPIDRLHRRTPGTAENAAGALLNSYNRCGHTWRGGVSGFRSGLCVIPPGTPSAGYPAMVLGLANRLAALAGHVEGPFR